MKIILDVKKTSKTQGFTKDDVMLHDGKEWYITSKESLIGDIEKKYAEIITDLSRKCVDLETKWAKFMQDYTNQNSKIIPILEELLKEKH